MRLFCSCVVPFCVGWRPVVHGTPTHAEWPMRLFSCILCCAILRGLASRCLRHAHPHRMANATFFLSFVLCHSAWVGVPLFTGRPPSQNGQCDFFPVFCVVPFCVGWRPVVYGTPTHAEWPMRRFSCFLCCAILRGLASRCLRDAHPHRSRDANPHRMASAMFFCVSGVVPFCEGWRPVGHGTPTLTEWPVPCFSLFLVLCHSVSVDVPLVTGRQPSHVPFFNQPSCSFHRYHVLVHSAAIGSPSSG